MTTDERRSAALLFSAELASGRVTSADLERREVRDAVRSRPVPPFPARLSERVMYARGRKRDQLGPLEAFAAARRAVLDSDGAGPPRLLIRVDEFPNYDSLDVPEHGTEAYLRFHEIMRSAGAPYLVAVQPAVAVDPLNHEASGGRPLDDEELAVLRRLEDDGLALALHGYDHRTRFERPDRRSELEGLDEATLRTLLDRGVAVLAAAGVAPRVFVPPFNTFSAAQYGVLAERFDVVCGGPESVARLGFHRTPLWRGEAVYMPAYPPLYAHAKDMGEAMARVVAMAPGTWVPVALHWQWELEAGWSPLERLLEAIAPYVAPWSDFLSAMDAARDGARSSRAA